MKKTVLLIITIALLTSILGCLSIERGRLLFVEERNYDIGRVIYNVPLPEPNEIIKIDERKSKYLYKVKSTGCLWFNIIDNKTKKIISWEFISDPDLCYLEFKGPF